MWERAIKEAGEGRLVVYTDGSRDGEVAGIRQALRMAPEVDMLVLTDSTAALQAIVRAARSRRGRTRDLRAYWKDVRSGERAQWGLGSGWVMRWGRRAVLRYTHLRVGKGDVGEWQRVIGAEGTLCRLCGVEEETGTHLVFRCEESYGLRPWNWASWEGMDDKRRWRYTVEGDGGKVMVRDKVEDFFVALDRALVGVG